MSETVQTLTIARDAAARNFEHLDEQIARARLDGDKEALGQLRERRDAALRDADEANDAIFLAEAAEAAAAEAGAVEAAKERASRAVELKAERVEAAAGVDNALVALEQAVGKYQALGRELGHLTKTGPAIARKASQKMRWSAWASAPCATELLCVPFANGNRRKTLSQLEGGV